jgi:citrate lyase subunit beta/citryl-CoA lyase
LFTAAAANVQPIDTVYVNFRDAQGLRTEAMEAARDGFTSKMAIHPNQVEIINEVFTPRPEDIAVSEEIVKAFADNPQAGVIGIRGQMVDRPHLARAQRILARAKAVASR